MIRKPGPGADHGDTVPTHGSSPPGARGVSNRELCSTDTASIVELMPSAERSAAGMSGRAVIKACPGRLKGQVISSRAGLAEQVVATFG